VDLLGAEYAVVTHAFPEGDFFLAKNLQLFEDREQRLVLYIQLLAFGIFIVGVVVARLSSRILSQPIVRLAGAIHELRDSGMAGRLDEQYADHELNEIAAAINITLDQVEESFRRERALISMASHELRTPVSVVLGAAAIIEKRGKLEADDARTLQRINHAAQDMSANIQALLDLVRRSRQAVSEEIFQIADLLRAIRADYEMDGEFDLSRLVFASTDNAQLCADKALVKMVLHNIISNALSHTRGQVIVTSHADHVEITDEGGMPAPAAAVDHPATAVEPQSAGLGLYIVSLACERLGWLFESDAQADGGRVRLWFKH
jgi:signal transduction histidine kinase